MLNKPSPDADVLVKYRNLLRELEKWRHEIELALHAGNDTHSLEDVVSLIMADRIQFFSWEDSFTMMEKLVYPQFAIYHCFLAGGSLDGVIRSIEPMKIIASALGCKYLSMARRSGWQKVLRKQGWRFVCTYMYLDLNEDITNG